MTIWCLLPHNIVTLLINWIHSSEVTGATTTCCTAVVNSNWQAFLADKDVCKQTIMTKECFTINCQIPHEALVINITHLWSINLLHRIILLPALMINTFPATMPLRLSDMFGLIPNITTWHMVYMLLATPLTFQLTTQKCHNLIALSTALNTFNNS